MKKKVVHPKAHFSFRRNVLPPVLGVVIMLGVMGLINGQYIAAQIHYRFGATPVSAAESTPVTTGTVKIDNNTKPVALNASPTVTIPSIKVDAPVVFEPSQEEAQFQLALRKGVVHFATTPNPGQQGNVVLFGHSSGQPWAPGDYKFVFTLLEKLQPGDDIHIDFEGVRYTYKMTSSEVVLPSNIGVLNSTDKHTLTLITCTPVGTSQKRLVVRAEQISPKPAAAVKTEAAPVAPIQPVQPIALPDGDQTSLWQTIRSWF